MSTVPTMTTMMAWTSKTTMRASMMTAVMMTPAMMLLRSPKATKPSTVEPSASMMTSMMPSFTMHHLSQQPTAREAGLRSSIVRWPSVVLVMCKASLAMAVVFMMRSVLCTVHQAAWCERLLM